MAGLILVRAQRSLSSFGNRAFREQEDDLAPRYPFPFIS